MKWASRIVAMINGGIFGYWCGFSGDRVDWWLWVKFMIVSSLAFIAGDLYRKARIKEWLNSQ